MLNFPNIIPVVHIVDLNFGKWGLSIEWKAEPQAPLDVILHKSQ
jgi:hypothetical protein